MGEGLWYLVGMPDWMQTAIVAAVIGCIGFFIDKWKKTKGW